MLNHNPVSIITDQSHISDLVWSPDSQHIAFSTDYIYAISADGSNRRQLASGSNPYWSSDGKLIVYEGIDGIYVMNADGSNQVKLTNFGTYPVWSPK